VKELRAEPVARSNGKASRTIRSAAAMSRANQITRKGRRLLGGRAKLVGQAFSLNGLLRLLLVASLLALLMLHLPVG